MSDKAAIVCIESDDVGNGTERNQRQQAVKLGLVLECEDAALAQLSPECEQHIKHHADASDGFAFKVAAGLIGVDDDVGIGQGNFAAHQGGQMVVGDQHLHAECPGPGHAVKTGNAVVNRDQQVGTRGVHPFGNRCGQAVAINDPVRHQVADAKAFDRCAQKTQAAQRHGAGRSTVAVVVRHHANLLTGDQSVGQQFGRGRCSQHAGRRQKSCQAVIEFVCGQHTTGRIQLGQQRVNAGLLERPCAARRNVSDLYFHVRINNSVL